ncbi:hypothetical protein EMIT0158MI4_90213 [Burkholderia ambifaria]
MIWMANELEVACSKLTRVFDPGVSPLAVRGCAILTFADAAGLCHVKCPKRGSAKLSSPI